MTLPPPRSTHCLRLLNLQPRVVQEVQEATSFSSGDA